jgi:hypothetical protein
VRLAIIDAVRARWRRTLRAGLWTAGLRSAPEAGVLIALMLWSLLPLAILFVSLDGGLSIGSGGVFTGADFPDVIDQLQYLSWIRDAGDHALLSNRFDLVADPHLFLHPAYALSGLAWRLGVSLQLALIAWRPVWVLALFVGYTAYVRRLVEPRPWVRAATLFLALFMVTVATPLVQWLDLGNSTLRFGTKVMGLEMFPGDYVVGASALAIGLMPLFLLGVECLLDPSRRRPGRSTGWYAGLTAGAGVLVSWLHPWQGLTLLVLVVGVTAWGGMWARARLLILPVLGTLAPLLYYQVLSHTHSAWQTVSRPNGFAHFGAWFFLAVLPPVLLALPGIPGRSLDVQQRLLRLWPLAALVVYLGLQRSWIYHAFVGLSLPLAILAVNGWRRRRLPVPVGLVLIVLFTLPGAAFYLQQVRGQGEQHFLASDEARALDYLARRPGAGGVLAREPLASAVPAFSGRRTWVGHPTWTPAYLARVPVADALVSGRLSPAQAQGFLHAIGARFVLRDCGARHDLGPLLGGELMGVRRFGCAVVYELDGARR